ncbi:MAG TPA: hypothetical protein VG076_13480 [Acidimicrobiales bacterium]|jgi:hypothetical protein|nr:hypothetical protein [Acidimicrobiales bacterium]
MSRIRVGVAVATFMSAIATFAFAAGPASAHEQRQVGAYQLTVGWGHEPTYTGVENAVQIFIKDAKGNPIDDLGTPPSLKVQVINGSQTSDPLDLKASFDPDTGLGMHGEFDAAIVPTVPGDYTFHFTGSINGQNIDQKFTSSDKTFDTVKDPTEIQFPAKVPSNGQLAQSVSRLDTRATTAAKNAQDSADTAKTLAIVGIAVGVVLGGAGLIVALSSRRRSA